MLLHCQTKIALIGGSGEGPAAGKASALVFAKQSIGRSLCMLSQIRRIEASINQSPFFYEVSRNPSPILGGKESKRSSTPRLCFFNAAIQLRIECQPLVFDIVKLSSKFLLPLTLRTRRKALHLPVILSRASRQCSRRRQSAMS